MAPVAFCVMLLGGALSFVSTTIPSPSLVTTTATNNRTAAAAAFFKLLSRVDLLAALQLKLPLKSCKHLGNSQSVETFCLRVKCKGRGKVHFHWQFLVTSTLKQSRFLLKQLKKYLCYTNYYFN